MQKNKKIFIVIVVVVFLILLPLFTSNSIILFFINIINKNKLPENDSMILFSEKIPVSYRKDFLDKVKDIAVTLDVDVNWLMFIMDFESAGTFSPSIKNQFGYIGLIQFGSLAATDLGTTVDALGQMTAVQQLDYVKKYFVRWSKYAAGYKSFIDLYMSVLYPQAINKPLYYTFGATFSKNNAILDFNKDGTITKGEILNVLNAWIKLNVSPQYWKNFNL